MTSRRTCCSASVTLVAVASLGLLFPPEVIGLFMEDKGNTPAPDANYSEWKGITPLINQTNRVYHTWVNGNESFWFRGNQAAVNEALKRFSTVGAKQHRLYFQRGPYDTKDRQGNKIPANWRVQVLTGICLGMVTSEGKGPSPVMIVFIDGGSIALENTSIPSGVVIVVPPKDKADPRNPRLWLCDVDPWPADKPDAVAGAMGSNQTIKCVFTAEVVQVAQLTAPLPPESRRHGYTIDPEPKWEVTLRVDDHHQKIPFQPGTRKCWIADIGTVFETSADNVKGRYEFTFTWNVSVPGRGEFEEFKARKMGMPIQPSDGTR